MTDSTFDSQNDSSTPKPTQAKLPDGWLSKWPWVTFLLPMIVFMVATSFEPKPPTRFDTEEVAKQVVESTVEPDGGFFAENPGEGWIPAISYRYYPHVYTAKIVVTLLAMLLVWPGYRTFPFRVSWLSVVVGAVGVVVWVGLCHLDLEVKIFGPIDKFLGSIVNWLPGMGGDETPSIGLMSFLGAGERSSFNPLKELAHSPVWAYTFLAIRFLGLAMIVPIFEEFFYRGFLMRLMVHPNWWNVPFGEVNRAALIAGTMIPALAHPAEFFAAIAWFSMITWLMLRTKSIWDCVVAHAVTNLLLGIYVVWFDQWQLM